ncbi:hypothetical protein AWZ03_014616, partial [Drosophila navojoa]
SSKG